MLFRLAARNLWRNKRRTVISLAAIVTGTFMVVMLHGFRNGVLDLITDGMVKAQMGAFQVHRKGFVDAIEGAPVKINFADTPELRQKILSVPGVLALGPRITAVGMAAGASTSAVVFLQALDPAHEYDVTPLAKRFVAGQNLASAKVDDAAVLGGPLMGALHLKAGDTFTVSAQTPEGQTNALDAEVVGWVPSADPLTGKRLMAVRLAWAQKLLRMEGKITEYAVAVKDTRHIDEVADGVRAALGPEFEVHTWLQLQPLFRDLIARQKWVLASVSLVLFAIVITGIVNVMAMSVYERVREIGTMMALGLRRRHILALFLFEAVILGALGGAVGAGLGFVVVNAVGLHGVPFKAPGASGYMPMHPSAPLEFVLAVVAIAGAGALFAGVLPAWRGSRLRPVDALRAL